MKPKQYLSLIADSNGFIPIPRFRWVIQKNPRKTAREEAIVGEILKQANPRENISGCYPWGPEEKMVLQQVWIHPDSEIVVWRDVPIHGTDDLYSTVDTEFGELPVPNSIREPEMIRGDFGQRLKEILGDDDA
jgi:hypothetical protein